MKRYQYTTILGFNILVACVTLLIWHYLTDFDVGLSMGPAFPDNKSQILDDNKISKYPWMSRMLTKEGGLGDTCFPLDGGRTTEKTTEIQNRFRL